MCEEGGITMSTRKLLVSLLCKRNLVAQENTRFGGSFEPLLTLRTSLGLELVSRIEKGY